MSRCRMVPLTRGKVALIDEDDADAILVHKWCCDPLGYAMRRQVVACGRQTTVRLHRQIMNAQPGEIVDHINGNPLDNRKENLRICTMRQNRQNSAKHQGRSRYKGVTMDRDQWRARIRIDGKLISLGHYESEQMAAIAYNAAAMQAFGEYARLNTIDGQECVSTPYTKV